MSSVERSAYAVATEICSVEQVIRAMLFHSETEQKPNMWENQLME